VVGGLIFSQLVTLYITPVYYVYLDRVQNRMNQTWDRWIGRGKRRKAAELEKEPELVQR
jgi:HAE1 family hydrophobic/amphiphilic exporter-1